MIKLGVVTIAAPGRSYLQPFASLGSGEAVEVIDNEGECQFGKTFRFFNSMTSPVEADPGKIRLFDEGRNGKMYFVAGDA